MSFTDTRTADGQLASMTRPECPAAPRHTAARRAISSLPSTRRRIATTRPTTRSCYAARTRRRRRGYTRPTATTFAATASPRPRRPEPPPPTPGPGQPAHPCHGRDEFDVRPQRGRAAHVEDGRWHSNGIHVGSLLVPLVERLEALGFAGDLAKSRAVHASPSPIDEAACAPHVGTDRGQSDRRPLLLAQRSMSARFQTRPLIRTTSGFGNVRSASAIWLIRWRLTPSI